MYFTERFDVLETQSYVRPGGPTRGSSVQSRTGMSRGGNRMQGGERGPSRGRRPQQIRKPRTSGLSGKHFEDARMRTEEMRSERHEGEKKKVTIPPLAPGDVRVLVLGGVEERSWQTGAENRYCART